MNVENLRVNYPKLISKMEEANYSKQYIVRVQRVIRKILESPNAWEDYSDLYSEYEAKSSRSKYPEMITAIGAVMRFDLFGGYPDNKHSGLTTKTAYKLLAPEFKQLIDNYLEQAYKRGKLKESTIQRNACCASSFMISLQNQNISNIEDITEEAIVSAFVSKEGIPQKSSTFAYCIREVFKSYPLCQKILPMIPSVKRVKKNVPYLVQHESIRIAETLNNELGKLPLRDKAIGILAYYTGLRWCDIVSLKLSSIDWENDIIKINQRKTGVPMELPLTATVGNAVYEYLVNERTDSQEDALFLTYDWHPRRMGYGRGCASAKIWREAGIRPNRSERKGLHIFRHHFATTLLSNGVPQPVITAALGQLAPESVERYLSADIENLRKCALSIASFPNAEGVFKNE